MANTICRFPSVFDDCPEPSADAIDPSSPTPAPANHGGPERIRESIRLSIFMLELALASLRTMSEGIGERAAKEAVDHDLSTVGKLLEFARTQARGIPDPDGASGKRQRQIDTSGTG